MTVESARRELAADALVIGLGGNVGDEDAIKTRFVRAREALALLGSRTRSAGLYRTTPIGPLQPSFLNTAIELTVADMTPDELVATVLELEHLLGRDRRGEVRWGPRAIDLDVLVWGARTIRSLALELPHPRIVERRFVLRPLVDLFGESLVLPGQRESLGVLERRVHAQHLEELASTW